jgi:sulfoxide reductase heme-binding subunit YedZ
MIRRLGGRRWKMLHRAIYASAIAAAIHYYLLVRADKQLPLAFAAAILLLLLWRGRAWTRRIGAV